MRIVVKGQRQNAFRQRETWQTGESGTDENQITQK